MENVSPELFLISAKHFLHAKYYLYQDNLIKKYLKRLFVDIGHFFFFCLEKANKWCQCLLQTLTAHFSSYSQQLQVCHMTVI